MVGALVISPTDGASEEAVVGSAPRVVVSRARAPRNAALQHFLEYLGFYHSDFEHKRNARSTVQFEGVLLELNHALRMRRLARIDRSALWLTFPPMYTNPFV